MNYTELYKSEASGRLGSYGIKIEAFGTGADLRSEVVRNAVYDALRPLESALKQAMAASNSEAQDQAAEQRRNLLNLFPSPIYIEELPNGYCSDGCCKHLPWFMVTTRVGRIKIGWRKSVINIDWTDTRDTKTAKELFPVEDVTKGERLIHAWGYTHARDYIQSIITGVPYVPISKDAS